MRNWTLRDKLVFSDGLLVMCIVFPILFYSSSTSQQVDVLRTSLNHAEEVNSAFLELSEIKRRIETLLFRMQFSQNDEIAKEVVKASQDFRSVILSFRNLQTSDYLLQGFIERFSDAELKIVSNYFEIARLEMIQKGSLAWPLRNQLTLLEPSAVVHKTDLSSYLTNLILDYTSEMESRRSDFFKLALASLLMSLLIVALRYRFIRYSILRPLMTLRNGIRRIREGRQTIVLESIPESPEINELLESFNKMSDSLEQNRQYREIFSAITAHDLKEPLGAILSLVRMREMELDESNLSKEDQELLQRLNLNATIGLNMIDGLLQLSRSSFREMSYQEIDLDRLVTKVFDELKVFYFNKKPELIIKKLGTIQGDLRQLETLFRNLFSNSIKFAQPSKDKVQITIWNSKNEDLTIPMLNIHIKDDGVGFDMKEYDKLVRPFEKINQDNHDHSDHHVMRGVGLGLAVCYRILKNHRGSFTATSQVGIGSEFILSFPNLSADELHELRRISDSSHSY